jgi:hypothetical protein
MNHDRFYISPVLIHPKSKKNSVRSKINHYSQYTMSVEGESWWSLLGEIDRLETELTNKRKSHGAAKETAVTAKRTRCAETRVVCLQRKNGKIVQDCDVYIGRRWIMGGWDLPQSKWANPYTIRQVGSAEKAVRLYDEYVRESPHLMASLSELEGKRLGCWCKKKPTDVCHGDVLVRLVNEMHLPAL